MFGDPGLAGRQHRSPVPSSSRAWRTRVVTALVLIAPLLAAAAARARAGCAVAEPQLWSPGDEGAAPLNSRVTLTLGGQAGLVQSLELRPSGGGPPVTVQRRTLAGPAGHQVVELMPEALLQPATTYEVVAKRPPGWHPSQWVFGAFTTGRDADTVAPELRVLRARIERAGASSAGGSIEVDIALRDGERAGGAALYAVWLPGEGGSLDARRPPDLYLPGRGNVLRLSADAACPDLAVPLPSASKPVELGLAAIDAAGNRSTVQRVAIPSVPRGDAR